MELRFNATEIGCAEENGASNAKAVDPYHYITIQGCSDPNDKDNEGIHFEIDDQINGDYNLLGGCTISRSQITFELLHDVAWHPGLSSIVVGCDTVPAAQVYELVEGLRRLFRDRPGDLHIELE